MLHFPSFIFSKPFIWCRILQLTVHLVIFTQNPWIFFSLAFKLLTICKLSRFYTPTLFFSVLKVQASEAWIFEVLKNKHTNTFSRSHTSKRFTVNPSIFPYRNWLRERPSNRKRFIQFSAADEAFNPRIFFIFHHLSLASPHLAYTCLRQAISATHLYQPDISGCLNPKVG